MDHGHDHSHEHDPHGHGTAGVPHSAEHKHPSVGEYTLIAVILFVLTGIEIWCSVTPMLQTPERHTLLLGSLSFFMVLKFGIVVGWFMHLKFDAHVYRRVFVAPLLVASLCALVVVVLTQSHAVVAP